MAERQKQQNHTKPPTSFGDTASAAELQRLVLQDAMFTEIFTPLLPPPLAAAAAPLRILDIASGPGIWATRVAKAYPQTVITCVDHDPSMLDYARLHARGEGVSNVVFEKADYRRLDETFSHAQFDFVHARHLLWYLGHEGRELVHQWSKLVKTGGMMRLTEWEASTTSSPSFNLLTQYLLEALYAHERSDNAYRVGMVYKLAPYLRAAGFSQVVETPHYVNFSAGTRYHDMYVRDITQGSATLQPFIVGSKVVTAEAYSACMRQAIREIDRPDFLGGHFFLSAWGVKQPLKSLAL
jgi:ubiquinone/menaquinone biosynthesis C-methylase UbiE